MIQTIISGGQTGVDRAALDAVLEYNKEIGYEAVKAWGWCPKGRRAEDGKVPARFEMRETPESDYRVRTTKNVLEGQGVLVLKAPGDSPGTRFTMNTAHRNKREFYIADPFYIAKVSDVVEWILRKNVQNVTVAGPRESRCPGIYAKSKAFVKSLITQCIIREIIMRGRGVDNPGPGLILATPFNKDEQNGN